MHLAYIKKDVYVIDFFVFQFVITCQSDSYMTLDMFVHLDCKNSEIHSDRKKT